MCGFSNVRFNGKEYYCSICGKKLGKDFMKKVELQNGYNKPSRKVNGKISKCEHDWVWSNNAGAHFCSKCNAWSYLGNHKKFSVAKDACLVRKVRGK